MLSEHTTSSPIKKRMSSSMVLQVNSMGLAWIFNIIQVKTIRVEQDRQSVVLELHYGRHGTDLNRATTWWRTLWRDSEPHETHFVKIQQPILKNMADTLRRLRLSLGLRPTTPNRPGARCDIPTPK